jgi:hypothetical protein
MMGIEPKVRYDKETIQNDLISMITEKISDRGEEYSAPITGATRLVADLGFPSLDIAILLGDINHFYHQRNIPFARLFLSSGAPVKDIQISTLADFLHRYLAPRANAD